MNGVREVSRGELLIPVIFLAIGLVAFWYSGAVNKNYGIGCAWLLGAVVVGMLLSKLFAFQLAMSRDGGGEVGPDQQVVVIDQGPSADFAYQVPKEALELIESDVKRKFEDKYGEKPNVEIGVMHRARKTILRENVTLPDGKKMRYYIGVVAGRRKVLGCDLSTEQSADKVEEICNFRFEDLFGDVYNQGGARVQI